MRYRILLQRFNDDNKVERSATIAITQLQSELVGLRPKPDGSQNKLDTLSCARFLEHLFRKVNKPS